MDIKNLEEALKLQKDFTTRIADNVEVLRRKKTPSIEAVLKEKELLVKHVREELKLATKERDSIIARLDDRIDRYKKHEARLKKEIKTLQDKLKKKPRKTTRGRRKTTKKPDSSK